MKNGVHCSSFTKVLSREINIITLFVIYGGEIFNTLATNRIFHIMFTYLAYNFLEHTQRTQLHT